MTNEVLTGRYYNLTFHHKERYQYLSICSNSDGTSYPCVIVSHIVTVHSPLLLIVVHGIMEKTWLSDPCQLSIACHDNQER